MFTIRTSYNSELRHSIGPAEGENFETIRYNSKLFDAALLYGRTFRIKDWYFTSLSAGPGYYGYTQKSLLYKTGSGPHAYDAEAYVKTEKFNGLGLALQHEQLFILDDGFGLGITAFANINAKRNVVGVLVTLVFGELR